MVEKTTRTGRKRSVERTAGSTGIQQPAEYISPLLPFHEWALATNSYELLDPRRRIVTEKWLTSEVTFGDLRIDIGVTSEAAVRYLVHTSIETMFPRVYPHLPKSMQEQCQSPKEAIKLKSLARMPLTIKRRYVTLMDMLNSSEGAAYKDQLSQSAQERWRRWREEEKPQGKSAFSEQGLANIKAHSGRRRRTTEAQ